MYPYLPLGPFLIQLPGLALLLGIWLGLSLAEREAKNLRVDPSAIYNAVFYGLVAGLLGARLVYAGRYLSAYLDDPLSLFALNPNTLSLSGGLLLGVGVAILYGWRKKLPLRPTLDALTPGLALFMVLFGVAHFLSGDAFGAPTDLPWAIFLWDAYRHPTQVYEFLAALVVFAVVWRWPQGPPGSGLNFLVFIALTAASRLFLEAFRGDSLLLAAGLRAAQVASLAVLMSSLWLLHKWALQGTESK
ncbi:MAG: prolipoprotein diacylglyceryl transferase [Anaerolineales bacterium]